MPLSLRAENLILDTIIHDQLQEPVRPAATGAFGNLYIENHLVTWRISSLENDVIDISAIREAISAIHMITRNRRTPLIIDLSDPKGIPAFTPTAKAALMGNDFLKLRSAVAFITNGITHRTIFLHLISFNKTNVPMKSFANEAEATQWLQSLHAN